MLSKTKTKTKRKSLKKTNRKVTAKTATRKKIKTAVKPSFDLVSSDIAHSPGHKRMNKIDKFSIPKDGAKVLLQESAVNNLSNSDIIRKHNSRHRRIISGAAVGKTGRITIKE